MLIESDGTAPAGLVHPGPRRRARVRASSSSTAGNRRATGRCRWPLFLHAAGFHCLTFDVRGQRREPGRGAAAERRRVRGRHAGRVPGTRRAARGDGRRDRRATRWARIGALLAGAADPRVAAVVATSGPADPYRLTRQTFRLAHLPIPDPIAYPLAWLTTRVYVRPRGHVVDDISAAAAIARYDGPVLLVHGSEDTVVPLAHMRRLAAAARAARAGDPVAAEVETLVVEGGQHSWLYEDPGYRRTVAAFLSRALGGPLDPGRAADLAEATDASRIPEGETQFEAVAATPGGLRTLAQVALPGATRPPRPEPDDASPAHRHVRDARRPVVSDAPAGPGLDRGQPASAPSAASPTGRSSAPTSNGS